MSGMSNLASNLHQFTTHNFYNPDEMHLSEETVKALAIEAGLEIDETFTAVGAFILGLPIIVDDQLPFGRAEFHPKTAEYPQTSISIGAIRAARNDEDTN